MKQPRKGGFEAHPLWAVIKTPLYLCCGQLEIYNGKVWITWRLRRKRSASSSQGRRDHLCQHWQLKGTAETENSLSCAQEEVCLLSCSHSSFSCIYIYSGSHLMHRLSPSPPEKNWQAARTSSGTTHYLPHTAVHWVEICPVEGGLQCLGCYFGFLFFLEKGRILFWLRAKAAALSILK